MGKKVTKEHSIQNSINIKLFTQSNHKLKHVINNFPFFINCSITIKLEFGVWHLEVQTYGQSYCGFLETNQTCPKNNCVSKIEVQYT